MSAEQIHPVVLVVMGVSGCGKSTVGSLLASRLGCPFYEGDAYHSPESIAKMASGVPLSDADRAPWLEALAAVIGRHVAAGQRAVVACSALKARHRAALLRGSQPPGLEEADGGSRGGGGPSPVEFVLLDPGGGELAARLAARAAGGGRHFMPPSLLGSQLAALERPPAPLLRVAGEPFPGPEAVVAAVLLKLGLPARAAACDGGG